MGKMTVRQRRLGDAMSLQNMPWPLRLRLVMPSSMLFSKPDLSSPKWSGPLNSRVCSLHRPAHGRFSHHQQQQSRNYCMHPLGLIRLLTNL